MANNTNTQQNSPIEIKVTSFDKSTIWKHRRELAGIVTTGIVIGKGLIGFVRKDKLGKALALGELVIGLGAAAIHTGVADKVVGGIIDWKTEHDYYKHHPEEYDPYDGPDPYDEADDGDDYDDDEVYDPDEEEEIGAEYDEDGLNPIEFDKFINSGESTEYDDGSDDVGGDHGEDSEEE